MPAVPAIFDHLSRPGEDRVGKVGFSWFFANFGGEVPGSPTARPGFNPETQNIRKKRPEPSNRLAVGAVMSILSASAWQRGQRGR